MKAKITMTKANNLTIQEAYDLFVRKAKVKNLSENTLKTYQFHFDAFGRYTDVNKRLDTVTTDIVDGFILYLREECDIKEITVCSYIRTIRTFLYYCMDCNYINRYKIQLPKVEKQIKETYTDEELSRLLEKPDIKKCSFTEYKVWVFENYLLGTGNRISSALNVRLCDVRFNEGVIYIRRTKNRTQQIIPLSKTLAEILKEYISIRGGEEEDYLFCNVYGEQGNRRTFQDLVQSYNLKRNVNKTSSHLFRHTFAKQWVLAGGDIFRLQKILGHSDLTVTREYVQMFGHDLQQDFDLFNPLDRMQKASETIKLHRK